MSLTNTNWNQNYLNTNGVRLHYVFQGECPLMLMLHGFPEFWYSWRHQIVAFSHNYRAAYQEMVKAIAINLFFLVPINAIKYLHQSD